jgi:superfamily II DNA or RNA helicase
MHGLTTGREWNVRASSKINPNISELYSKIFEVYWLDDRIKDFNEKEFTENTSQDLKGYELVNLSSPYNFQQDILDELSRMRAQGFNKNLLVAATGTGKTVISAYEIKKFLSENPAARILFVAHREEILTQSMATFRHVIGDRKFGDILTGSKKPKND